MKADPILIHYALELFEDEFISNSLLQCFFFNYPWHEMSD